MKYSHLFGPVHSRRLGRSLVSISSQSRPAASIAFTVNAGILPGETTERQEFFPLREVLEELRTYLSSAPVLDFITFSGSGEPTLSTSIGDVICFLKESYPQYRVAVLTNGSLFWRFDVRNDLMQADLVLPTLSSVFEETFSRIQRPAPGIHVAEVIEGLIQFRREYAGEIWLEVFIIPGINTSRRELEGLRVAIEQIAPDRVQVNTLDRPGTEHWVRPASPAELERIRGALGISGLIPVEPIRYELTAGAPMTTEWEEAVALVRELIRRRLCTLEDITTATGLSRREILKILREIQISSGIQESQEERGIFFFCPE